MSALRLVRLAAPALAVVALVSTAPPARATGGPGDLYVTSDASDLTRAYDGASGLYLGVFTPSTGGGSGQMAVHFGPTQGRVLIGHGFSGVEEHDLVTGALIKVYEPAGGWQWAGIYAPNGNVYVGSMLTNDVRVYDANTGAFLSVLCPLPAPADMEIGPNGNLFICSFGGGFVREVNALTGAPIGQWSLPAGAAANDIAFLNGEYLVTAMNTNVCYRYDAAYNLVGQFAGTGWQRPHGIAIGPTDGRIYIADGTTTQVHVFDPLTFVELNPAFLVPNPGDKIVDLAFQPEAPTPARVSSWGRVKANYR